MPICPVEARANEDALLVELLFQQPGAPLLPVEARNSGFYKRRKWFLGWGQGSWSSSKWGVVGWGNQERGRQAGSMEQGKQAEDRCLTCQ